MSSPSSTIFEAITSFFDHDGWETQRIGDETALRLRFTGTSMSWSCLAIAKDDARQFVFYSVLPASVAAPRRAAVADYLAQANWGLAVGCFESERATGEVRLRTSIAVGASELGPELCRHVVESNLALMDRYGPGVELVDGGAEADEALAKVE